MCKKVWIGRNVVKQTQRQGIETTARKKRKKEKIYFFKVLRDIQSSKRLYIVVCFVKCSPLSFSVLCMVYSCNDVCVLYCWLKKIFFFLSSVYAFHCFLREWKRKQMKIKWRQKVTEFQSEVKFLSLITEKYLSVFNLRRKNKLKEIFLFKFS